MKQIQTLDLNKLKDKIFYLETRIAQFRAKLNRTLEEELALFEMISKLKEIKIDFKSEANKMALEVIKETEENYLKGEITQFLKLDSEVFNCILKVQVYYQTKKFDYEVLDKLTSEIIESEVNLEIKSE